MLYALLLCTVSTMILPMGGEEEEEFSTSTKTTEGNQPEDQEQQEFWRKKDPRAQVRLGEEEGGDESWDKPDTETGEDINTPKTKIQFKTKKSSGFQKFQDSVKRISWSKGNDYVQEVIKQTLEGNKDAIAEFDTDEFRQRFKTLTPVHRQEVVDALKTKLGTLRNDSSEHHNLIIIIDKLELSIELQEAIKKQDKSATEVITRPSSPKPTTAEREAQKARDSRRLDVISHDFTDVITLPNHKTVADYLTDDGLLNSAGERLSRMDESLGRFLDKADTFLVPAHRLQFFEKFISLAKNSKPDVSTIVLIDDAYSVVASARETSEAEALRTTPTKAGTGRAFDYGEDV